MGNNMLVYTLDEQKIEPESDYHPSLLKIEDNIGESIHIHYRDLRIDLTIQDFNTLAKKLDELGE